MGLQTLISAFNFTEAKESGTGTIGKDGSVTRIFYVAWTDLPGFMQALVPGWTKIHSNAWYYWPGDRHPDFPTMYCESADFQSMGQATWDGTKSSWAQARITAKYKTPTFDPQGKDLFEEELDISVEELQIPAGSYQDGSGNTVPTTLRKIIPTCAYTLTLLDVPELPGGDATLIWSLAGKINLTAVKGAATETMLFLGARTDRTMTSQGTRGWKISLKFLVRPFSWNQVWTAKAGGLVAVTAKVGGDTLYTKGELNNLLKQVRGGS